VEVHKMGWLYKQWKLIEGNAKFYVLLLLFSGLSAMTAGLVAVWHALSWKGLAVAALAFLSGWIVAVAVIWRQRNPGLTIHYAGWGLDDNRYKDVTLIVKGCINEGKIDIPASVALFGDPYPGNWKHLRVRYSYSGFSTKEVIRMENDQLRLP
jgi:hypothetical protein